VNPKDSCTVEGWDPRIDTSLDPEAFCTNFEWRYNLFSQTGVYECLGHDNPDFASEKKGYWYESVEGGPKDLRFKFLDKDNKVIYEKVYKGCARYRTLPEHLQHKWKEVFKRIVFDEATGEMIDEKLKIGARSSEVEDFRGDYLKHEVYTNDAHSFIGFEPTCPRPSSVVRIETRNAHNNAIIRIVDDKMIIDHACSKKLGCTVCRKLLKGKIEGGARDIITTFVYTAGGEVEPPDQDPLFPTAPLKGVTMLETFSGDPTKGGAMLSQTWERAGGKVESRDILLDPTHDFHLDDKFW